MKHVKTRFHASSLVGELILNNPKQSNAMTAQLLKDLPVALAELLDQGARAIVVHSIGISKNFCAGLSMESLSQSSDNGRGMAGCQARQRWHFREYILSLQRAMTIFEGCDIPVIAAIHGACVGAGVDLITACDIRLCTTTATFCVKEADLGIVADMGTLSRLPGIVGDGIARHISLTAETIDGVRAAQIHLVSEALPTTGVLLDRARELAASIAKKSPLAIAGTKEVLLYQRDHGRIDDSLRYVATLNASLLPGNEDVEAIMDDMKTKQNARRQFSKL